MALTLTKEQKKVLDYIKALPLNTINEELVLINSVAGSGKTTLLAAIAKSIPHTNSLNLCYNRSIATSSQSKFPASTHCMTTHAMAYRAVVNDMGLRVGVFNYRSIKESLSYDDKCLIVDLINEFCLSSYTDYTEFSASINATEFDSIAAKYLTQMQSGKIECSHSFYLKLFHILLAQSAIEYDPFDFIMLDEAGDLNEVTLEIFKLLPAKLKIAVGDPHQNIYSFNHTINCFELLEDVGTTFTLSQSFRVPQHIASDIERFCTRYLDPNMSFQGIPVSDPSINTRGYITRTNSSLIAKMIELNKERIPYSLVRRASEIFKLPLMLASMKYQHFISDTHYKHIQSDFDDWHDDAELRKKYGSPYTYIANLYEDDVQLVQGCKLLSQYGKSVVFNTYYEAKKHENAKQTLTLTTAHSAKGLEFDEVTIAEDLNDSLTQTILLLQSNPDLIPNRDQRDVLNLYYVACSRALKSLNNAVHLRNL